MANNLPNDFEDQSILNAQESNKIDDPLDCDIGNSANNQAKRKHSVTKFLPS